MSVGFPDAVRVNVCVVDCGENAIYGMGGEARYSMQQLLSSPNTDIAHVTGHVGTFRPRRMIMLMNFFIFSFWVLRSPVNQPGEGVLTVPNFKKMSACMFANMSAWASVKKTKGRTWEER